MYSCNGVYICKHASTEFSDTEHDHVDVDSLMYQQKDQVLRRAELLNFLQDAGCAMCRVTCTSEKKLITLDGGRAAVACVNYKGPTQLTTKNNAVLEVLPHWSQTRTVKACLSDLIAQGSPRPHVLMCQ